MVTHENLPEMITSEETDLLQEIMNIAFGRAAADLAEFIDIFVVLSVPQVKLLQIYDLPRHLQEEIKEFDKVSVVQQSFWGKFKGNAFLVFPAGSGKSIVSLFDNENMFFQMEPSLEMEKTHFWKSAIF